MSRLVALGIMLALVSSSAGSDMHASIDERWNVHPRLFFVAGDIPELQTKAQATHREIWTAIQDYVDHHLDDVAPATPPPDGGVDTYRNYANQLIPFAFTCVLTEIDRYCDLAKAHLLTYAHWNQWDENNYRDLGHSHMLLANALAYDWLYPRLTPEERQTVSASLVSWAQRLYDASTQPPRDSWNNWWSRSYLQNHHWIAHSALGMAGLALLGDETEIVVSCFVSATFNVNLRSGPGTDYAVEGGLRAGETAQIAGQGTVGTDGLVWWQLVEGLWVRSDVVSAPHDCSRASVDHLARTWIDAAIMQMIRVKDFLNGINDGSWHEGIQYQNYALTMALPFMVNLRLIEGVDLLPHAYLRHYPLWRVYNFVPGSSEFVLTHGNVDLSWGNSFAAQNVLRFTASEYRDGYAEWMAQRVVEAEGRRADVWRTPWYVFEFFYYDPYVAPQAPADLPLARTFADLEAVVWRTGWGANDLAFGLKTGAYGGRFAFDTFTQAFYPWNPPCQDTGCQLNFGHDHDDANTFYLQRGAVWLIPENAGYDQHATEFHNTLLIDGQGQGRPVSRMARRPDDLLGTDGFIEAVASAPNTDYVAADATRRYWPIADLKDFTRHVVFVRPDYFVMVDNVAADSPHQYEWVAHFGAAVSVDGDWVIGESDRELRVGVRVIAPDPFDAVTGDDGRAFVRVEPASPVDSVRFILVLYPSDAASWDRRPAVTLLEDNGEIVALRVQANDGTGRVDDVLVACTLPATSTAVGPYEFDGRAAVIARQQSGALASVFVYGGTHLKAAQDDGEPPLVSGLAPDDTFAARFTGEQVAVSGDFSAPVTIYAPGGREVTLNGQPWVFTRSGESITVEP